MTLGSAGAMAFYRLNDEVVSVSCEGVIVDRVVDATGAGDAFIAGFLIDWLLNKDISSALRRGCLCGAVAVMSYGGSVSSVESFQSLEKKVAW